MSNILTEIEIFLENQYNFTAKEREFIKEDFKARCDEKIKASIVGKLEKKANHRPKYTESEKLKMMKAVSERMAIDPEFKARVEAMARKNREPKKK